MRKSIMEELRRILTILNTNAKITINRTADGKLEVSAQGLLAIAAVVLLAALGLIH
jgi:hypothetical protein